MPRNNRWLVLISIFTSLQFFAGPVLAGPGVKASSVVKPVQIELIEGSNLSRITLTAKAAERINVTLVPVREEQDSLVVPYSSLLYDPQGYTWLYTNLNPLVFVRHPVDVDRIVGDMVVLTSGPKVGTVVVTVGAVELYGAEFEIGK